MPQIIIVKLCVHYLSICQKMICEMNTDWPYDNFEPHHHHRSPSWNLGHKWKVWLNDPFLLFCYDKNVDTMSQLNAEMALFPNMPWLLERFDCILIQSIPPASKKRIQITSKILWMSSVRPHRGTNYKFYLYAFSQLSLYEHIEAKTGNVCVD